MSIWFRHVVLLADDALGPGDVSKVLEGLLETFFLQGRPHHLQESSPRNPGPREYLGGLYGLDQVIVDARVTGCSLLVFLAPIRRDNHDDGHRSHLLFEEFQGFKARYAG